MPLSQDLPETPLAPTQAGAMDGHSPHPLGQASIFQGAWKGQDSLCLQYQKGGRKNSCRREQGCGKPFITNNAADGPQTCFCSENPTAF